MPKCVVCGKTACRHLCKFCGEQVFLAQDYRGQRFLVSHSGRVNCGGVR